MLQVCSETLRQLESQGVVVEVLPMPEAVETYNRLGDGETAVGALIHSDLPPVGWTRVTAYAAAASCSLRIGVT